MNGRPLALLAPWPRPRWMVLDDEAFARLGRRVEWLVHEGSAAPDELVERVLPEVAFVIGQPRLPADRIARAPKLRAVVNVKGNWEPTLDYAACEARRIPVLSIAPAMAPAVAEMALALALDLARGITPADAAFRRGEERYGIASNGTAFLLRDAAIGMIGFGNLGMALRPLLAPFGGRIRVYDPWLPDGHLRDAGVEPAALDAVLAESRVLFVLAGVTSENEGFLDRARLERIRRDAAVVLISRAEVVDFDAFVELAEAGHFRAAIDVFPEEPVPAEHPVRRTTRILLSAHRAGGMAASYARISEMLREDLELLLDGLPPVRLQRAQARTAAVARSR
jgi:phosphoglycerate dehydrogenase-like enzyme